MKGLIFGKILFEFKAVRQLWMIVRQLQMKDAARLKNADFSEGISFFGVSK